MLYFARILAAISFCLAILVPRTRVFAETPSCDFLNTIMCGSYFSALPPCTLWREECRSERGREPTEEQTERIRRIVLEREYIRRLMDAQNPLCMVPAP